MNVPRLGGARRGTGREELVVLTADDQPALAARVRDAAAFAREADRPLREWAAEITREQSGGALALAVVGSSCSQVSDKLRHAAERLADPRCTRINDRSGIFFTAQPLHPAGGRVAVLFPGEGSQYPGMLGDLCIRFGAARAAFDRADRAFEHHPRGLLPSQLAFGDASPTGIWDMDSAVEMVFTGNAAVHAVLGTLGLEPDVVVGHSTGDYSALFASGAIRAADDGEIVRLMLGLNTVYQELAGMTALPERALLAVGAGDAGVIERVLAEVPGLDLAMDNCPHQRVLCGAPPALAQARERLAAEGAILEELAFRRGYHSEAFRPALGVLQPFFDALPLQAPSIELWSCASASRVPEDLEALRTLALEQWAMPVRFTETVQRLWDEGVRIFVEAGPRGNLTAFLKDILRDRPHLAVACDGTNRPTVSHLLFALGQLAVHRVPLDLSPLGGTQIPRPPTRPGVNGRGSRRSGPVLTLATGWPDMRLSPEAIAGLGARVLPRRREQEVHDSKPAQASEPVTRAEPTQRSAPETTAPAVQDPRAALLATHLAVTRRMVQAQERVITTFLGRGAAASRRPPARLLSGAAIRLQGDSLTATVRLSIDRHPFLAHHTLGGPVSAVDPTLTGLPVMPFTMTLELAAEAALELAPGLVCVGFENVMARRWIALEAGEHADLEITAERRASGAGGVTVSVEIGSAGSRERGDANFGAQVRLAPSYPSAPVVHRAHSAGGGLWDRARVYRKAMFHGPMFQGIERITRLDEHGAEADIEVLERKGLLADGEPAFAVDPVLLDQPGQVVGVWTADRLTSGFVIFPTRLARLDLFSPVPPAGVRLACHARIRLVGASGVTSDLDLHDGAGRIYARFAGWEDKRFDVPASFLAFMLDPRRSSLCRPWIPDPARGDAAFAADVRIVRADLPSGFSARGGIWQQVLAGLTLSRSERGEWHASLASSADAAQWLLCRLAAKDAARRWLAERGLAIPPADIVITGGVSGELRASGEWASAAGGGIELTVAVADGDVVAAVRRRADQTSPVWPASTAAVASSVH